MKLPEKSKRTEFRELAGGEQKNGARGEAAEAPYPPAHLALHISSMWLEFRELAGGEQEKNGAGGEAAEAPYPPAHLALRFSSMWLAICIL